MCISYFSSLPPSAAEALLESPSFFRVLFLCVAHWGRDTDESVSPFTVAKAKAKDCRAVWMLRSSARG